MVNLKELGLGRLSRRTAWVGASKSAGFLAVLLANIYLARTLNRGEFGRYQQGWLYISTLVPILLLGIPQAVNYFLPPASADRIRGYICAFLCILIVTGAVAALTAFLFPATFARLIGNVQLTILIPIVGLYVLFVLPSYLLEPLLILRGRVRELLGWTLLFAAIFLAIAVRWGKVHNLKGLFGALVFLAALKTIVTVGRTGRIFGGGRWRLPSGLWTNLLKYLGVLGAIALVDVFTVQIDKYLVSHFLGAGKFAIYAIGAIELPIVGLLLSSVTAVVMPEISRHLASQRHTETIKLLHRSMEKLALVLFPLFLYLLITAHFYIPFFFSHKYQASVVIFYIYLIMLPIRAMNNHPYLIAAGLQRYALYGRLMDIAVNFIVGLLLLRWIGILGPAISTVIGTYVHKSYQTAIMARHLGLGVRELYPWRRFGRVALRAAMCGIIAGAVILLFGSNLMSILSGTVLFAFIYIVLLPSA